MESKCPACGEPMRLNVCTDCLFRCNLCDLPRIAAAMELAKAYTAFNKEKDPIKANELWPETKQAEQRVLEVFNG